MRVGCGAGGPRTASEDAASRRPGCRAAIADFCARCKRRQDGERAPRVARRLHSPCRGKGRAGAGLPKPISPAILIQFLVVLRQWPRSRLVSVGSLSCGRFRVVGTLQSTQGSRTRAWGAGCSQGSRAPAVLRVGWGGGQAMRAAPSLLLRFHGSAASALRLAWERR